MQMLSLDTSLSNTPFQDAAEVKKVRGGPGASDGCWLGARLMAPAIQSLDTLLWDLVPLTRKGKKVVK